MSIHFPLVAFVYGEALWLPLKILLSLLAISLVLLTLASPVIVGGWILHPLDGAARHRQRATRFTVLDFLGLCFLIQIPMALVRLLGGFPEEQHMELFYAMGWLASGLIWWNGVKTFSRAGIDATWTRGLLVFVVLPMAYFGSFAVLVLAAVLISSPPEDSVTLGVLVCIEIALVIGVVFSGRYTRRVVARTRI